MTQRGKLVSQTRHLSQGIGFNLGRKARISYSMNSSLYALYVCTSQSHFGKAQTRPEIDGSDHRAFDGEPWRGKVSTLLTRDGTECRMPRDTNAPFKGTTM